MTTTDQQAVTVAQIDEDYAKEYFGDDYRSEYSGNIHMVEEAHAAGRLASVSSASANWTSTKAFDEAAAECMRAAEASTFADTVSEDERNGHRSACNLLAMNFRVMASRAAPEWLSRPVVATQPATSQEGKAVTLLRTMVDHFDAHGVPPEVGEDYRTADHILAATPTPPTLSEDLRDALQALERQAVALYRAATPAGNYGANAEGSDANQNAFADKDPAVIQARAALAQVKAS